MATSLKNVYFDVRDNIVNKYNNTVDSYAEYNEDFNDEDPKFKVGGPKFKDPKLRDVRISKYKNIFSKGYTHNQSKEVFIIDVSKLSDVVKLDVKKAVYDKLAAKVSSIDISAFVLKTKYQTDKAELEKKT